MNQIRLSDYIPVGPYNRVNLLFGIFRTHVWNYVQFHNPNVFNNFIMTPSQKLNYDMINDRGFDYHTLRPTFLDFKIFDRWGTEVFSTQTFGEGWDGTLNGEDAKEDVYIFVVQFRAKENPEIIIERGRLNLLR